MGKLKNIIYISALVVGIGLPLVKHQYINYLDYKSELSKSVQLSNKQDRERYLANVTTGVNVNKWDVVKSDIRYAGQNQ